MPSSPVRKVLPPLVCAALLAVVLLRLAGDPERTERAARLDALLASEEEVDAFAAAYRDDEGRRAAARAYFRLGRLRKGIEAAWSGRDPDADPAAVRDFAALALRALGWRDDAHWGDPTWLATPALSALVDARTPGAEEFLARTIREGETQGSIRYFLAIYQRGLEASRRRVAEALRARGERGYDTAAAITVMDRDPYPGRAEDLALLRQALETQLPQMDRARVGALALALARSEDPAAVEALRRAAAGLASSAAPDDRTARALLAAGLVAAGRWEEGEPVVLPWVATPEPMTLIVAWYQWAILHRHRRGDPLGLDRLQRLWRGPSAAAVPELRATLGAALTLGDGGPDPAVLAAGFLSDLEAEGIPLEQRMVGRAWRVRRGEPGALREVLDLLASLDDGTDAWVTAAPPVAHPAVVGLRALLLFAGLSRGRE